VQSDKGNGEASNSRAVNVAVQTDFCVLHQVSTGADVTIDTAASSDATQTLAKQKAAQQTSAACAQQEAPLPPAHRLEEEEAQAADQAAPRSKDAGCDARSDADLTSDEEEDAQPEGNSTSFGRAHSSTSSSSGISHARQSHGRSSAAGAHRSTSPASVVKDSRTSHSDAAQAPASPGGTTADSHRGNAHGYNHLAVAAGQQDGNGAIDGARRRVPVGDGSKGQQQEAKGKADGRWSRGLQLPQKLSIASLAKHAGVDRAFMQVS